MANDNSTVKWGDLKHYTEKFKEYIDYKLVPVPADCEQLKIKIYKPEETAFIIGWSLPTGYSNAKAGTTFEYYFVEDNKVVAKCKGVFDGNYTYNYTWLDNTTCPEGISFYENKYQASDWSQCCYYQVSFYRYVDSNSKHLFTVNLSYIENIFKTTGRYTVYARKIA